MDQSMDQSMDQGAIAGNSAQAIQHVEFAFESTDDPSTLWRVVRLQMIEGLSESYEIEIELQTGNVDVEVDNMLGTDCTIRFERDTSQRAIFGIVDQLSDVVLHDQQLSVQIRVVPALQMLDLNQNCRVWQHQSAVDIVSEILKNGLSPFKREFQASLIGEFAEREYCVQYRESDLDFVKRLLWEEGIGFYFEFDPLGTAEKLVLFNANSQLPELDLLEQGCFVDLVADHIGRPDVETVQRFSVTRRIGSKSFTRREFDWKQPQLMPSTTAEDAKLPGPHSEVYDFGVGRFATQEHVKKLANTHFEQIKGFSVQARGFGNVVEFVPGMVFELRTEDDQSPQGRYLITRVGHFGDCPDERLFDSRAASGSDRYTNNFDCIPIDLQYRPPMVDSRPKIFGPQTAIVVAPENEEIETQENGCVRVLFHWDRESNSTDGTPVWVRVSQSWAGNGFGAVFLPRVGMEVVVEFLDGNPDRPLVVGCVFNGDNKPPHDLPKNKSKSTWRSQSTPDGEGFHEISIEDLKGKEEMYVRSQRNFRQLSRANHSLTVGGQMNETISGPHQVVVGKDGNSTDSQLDVHGFHYVNVSDTLTETVGFDADQSKRMITKGVTETVVSDEYKVRRNEDSTFWLDSKGTHFTDTKNFDADAPELKVSSGENVDISLSNKDKITIHVGDNKVLLDSSGVTISATKVSIDDQGKGSIVVQGGVVKVNGTKIELNC